VILTSLPGGQFLATPDGRQGAVSRFQTVAGGTPTGKTSAGVPQRIFTHATPQQQQQQRQRLVLPSAGGGVMGGVGEATILRLPSGEHVIVRPGVGGGAITSVLTTLPPQLGGSSTTEGGNIDVNLVSKISALPHAKSPVTTQRQKYAVTPQVVQQGCLPSYDLSSFIF